MAHIGCTAKLIKALKIPTSQAITPTTDTNTLFNWHANLLMVKHRPCVLFIHDDSLFNMIIPDFPINKPKEMNTIFLSWLSTVLQDNNIPKSMIDAFTKGHESIDWGKTSKRSVIGSMNEFMMHYEFMIDRIGGIDNHQFPSELKKMNRIPMKPINYELPVNQLRTLLKDN